MPCPACLFASAFLNDLGFVLRLGSQFPHSDSWIGVVEWRVKRERRAQFFNCHFWGWNWRRVRETLGVPIGEEGERTEEAEKKKWESSCWCNVWDSVPKWG